MVTIREKAARPQGVTSRIDAQGTGAIEGLSGGSATLSVTQTEAGFTPLELLDGALAGCLAISIRHAAKQRGWLDRLGDVAVTVSHEKASDAPSRVAGFTASYSFSAEISEAEQQVLIAEAHRLCTVGNTFAHGAVVKDG